VFPEHQISLVANMAQTTASSLDQLLDILYHSRNIKLPLQQGKSIASILAD
jgi:hypothetical protein